MNWYFNDQGVAKGPHDEDQMRELLRTQVIHSQTLVWHSALKEWQEAAVLKVAWLGPEAPAKPAAGGQSPLKAIVDGQPAKKGIATAAPHRMPVPMAPSKEAEGEKKGFFKKLFGGGKKK